MPNRHALPRVCPGPPATPLVLVVEEDTPLQRILLSTLASHGFRCIHAGTTAETLARGAEHNPDLVLLDLARPELNELAVTRRLRHWTQAPILVISPRAREEQKVAVLDAGANDYIVKPFSTGELLARMRVWLRYGPGARHRRATPARESTPARVRFDRHRRILFVDGRQLHLTPLEHKILSELTRTPGKLVSAHRLVAAVWGAREARGEHALRRYIAQLRHKIEKDPARPRYLIVEGDLGYRLRLQ